MMKADLIKVLIQFTYIYPGIIILDSLILLIDCFSHQIQAKRPSSKSKLGLFHQLLQVTMRF